MDPNEITCKIVPLYKITIYDEEHSGDEYHAISDTISGLIRALVDMRVCVEDRLDKGRMYFEITDFLVMPCTRAKCGYHLFDIDAADISPNDLASNTTLISEICVKIDISTGGPNPMIASKSDDVAVVNADDILEEIDNQYAYARAIYRMSESGYKEHLRKNKEEEEGRTVKATAAIKKKLSEE